MRAAFRRAFVFIAFLVVCWNASAANLSGTIRNTQGTPICGLVLANGQFTFSCSPNGTYSLQNVPLDGSGQITLYGFAEGHFPFKAVLSGSTTTYDITVSIASVSAPAETSRTKTERLVGGTWSMTYTIVSTFTDRFTFTSVAASTATPGDWNAFGTDAFGGTVVGTYSTQLGQWAILNPGITIDEFFVFTFIDNNRVSGCYYLISPAGSTNFGTCRSMTGTRSPPKSLAATPDSFNSKREDREMQRAIEALNSEGEAIESYEDVLEMYRRARQQVGSP